MSLFRKSSVAGLSISCVLLVAVACGGDDGEASTGTATSSAPTATAQPIGRVALAPRAEVINQTFVRAIANLSGITLSAPVAGEFTEGNPAHVVLSYYSIRETPDDIEQKLITALEEYRAEIVSSSGERGAADLEFSDAMFLDLLIETGFISVTESDSSAPGPSVVFDLRFFG